MPTSVPQTRMSNSSLTQLNRDNGTIEGWRAVISVVLRYGIGQRQRMSTARNYLDRAEENSESSSSAAPASAAVPEQGDMDVDGIDVMMAGVKSRGVGFLSSHYVICY
jgi:hypothetical protein